MAVKYTVNVKTTIDKKDNDDVQVKVKTWKQEVLALDEVTFEAHSGSNVDVILVWKDNNSPFDKTGDTIPLPQNGSAGPYTVRNDVKKSEEYTYSVTGKFADNEPFAVDPRFIIGPGSPPPL